MSGSRRGGGGGGAGGWVQVIGGTITQLDAINANGGTGGVGSGDSSKGYGGTGGNGDYGTVLVQYCTSTVAIGGTTKTVQQIPCTGTSESTWAFNTLSGDSSASSTLANTNTTFFCGTNYHATMICPAVSSENGTIFVRFTGTQFMGSQAAISETSNVIRIRLRTSQANDGKVGIYGVVKNFNADSYEAFDRELFFDRGKVCSRLFQGPTDIICTTSRYDDGQWHLIERSYGGSTPAHRLRVDNEVVTGQYTFSAFNWKNGAIIGNSGMFELLTKFRGDIDYVSTGLAP